MKLTRVRSSNVSAVGHDAEGKAAVVLFHSGAAYRYGNVEREQFEELLAARSKGAWVRYNLVQDKANHSCTRLDAETVAAFEFEDAVPA